VRTSAALAGGALVIGSLDITYAIAFWASRGVGATRIFQSISAGLLGRSAAMQGGLRTALLGCLLHYFISFCIVLVYYLASKRLRVLTERPILCGALYGIGVYVVMNYVVIPLSATTRSKFLLSWVVCSVIVHALLIGIPAALFSRAARSAA